MGFNFTPDSFLEFQEFSISKIANNQTQKFQIPLSGLALNLSLRDFQNHINKLYILGQGYWMFWFSTPCIVVHLYFPFKISLLKSTSPKGIY